MATLLLPAWHVAPGGVLVIVDLDHDGWRFVTHDAAGIVHDLAELQPDLLNRVPLIAYQDSMGQWDAPRVSSKGAFAGFAPIAQGRARLLVPERTHRCAAGQAQADRKRRHGADALVERPTLGCFRAVRHRDHDAGTALDLIASEPHF